ncbi:fatty acid desaturase family protein [Zhongshania aquimaris]|uniref:Fatty acid desaturase n=1 Tax=Zhongshania aquimaris TaxID=2857107 RepID=A0ABS6VUK4_9GAMM|nr:fatty acid desaturase [Zhongshania aquimaris]MBW2942004.1 fatty acid desaturase [Zhongshania aquimaris]
MLRGEKVVIMDAELNKKALGIARNYIGSVAWPTVVLTLLVCSLFIICLVLFATGYLSVWLATPLISVLTYMSYTTLHEAVHGNIHGSNPNLRWVNDLCGYLVGPIISVPYNSHKHEHFAHHRYTNIAGKDPDFIISGMRTGLFAALLTTLKFFYVQNTFFYKQHWRSAKLKERFTYCLEIQVSIGWRVLTIALVEQPGIAVVVLLGYFTGGFFTAYWFAYRPHFPYDNSERYQNTSSLIMPMWMKPIEWLWLGQNIHSIHHLFPRVPFYHYRALHRDIEPVLRAQGTPIIGIWSRKPITVQE